MKIDSFLEKILENNDSLVFGTNNVSNKKMLDMANDCAKNYCKYINIPERVEIEEPKKEEKPVKSIIKKLSENVKKLDQKIDKKIDTIEKEFP